MSYIQHFYTSLHSIRDTTGYKYTLVIRTSNQDGVADLEKLVNYYKSIGATVVEKAAKGYYDVKFDYAQSVVVESAGSYIQVQFSVVKQ